ncbi:UNVERIFIED_CONTAM: hypothetical protein HDU68_000992 [Siphonaria sp. JEL0065]|nr:hypothetical protein HDU68_000992 [Siphonaria sp. JEL0065]
MSTCRSCLPAYLSNAEQQNIKSAIQKSLDAASQISNLYSFYLDISTGPVSHHVPQERKEYYGLTHDTAIFFLFEATLVLWFVICRMQSVWWSVVGLDKKPDWNELKLRIIRMVEFIKMVSEEAGLGEGTFMPLVVCSEAMLKEMDELHQYGSREVDAAVDDELVLGMKVMSLGTLNDDEDNVVMKEPRAFLGLLGMQVGRGLRWMGPAEDRWRLFWKVHS